MMLLASLALSGCLAVGAGSEHVVAADLAPGFPGLKTIPPETILGFAPVPGVARVFLVPELRAIAARFNLDSPETEICVQRPVAPLVPEALAAAMRQELPEAAIEILDYSHQSAPVGAIEFHRADLRNGPAGTFWTGYIRYAGNHRFAIWTKVKVSMKSTRAVAAGDLRPGKPISAGDILIDPRDEFPDGRIARSLAEVEGKWPRVFVRAGSEIRLDALENPKDVMRGETVRVEVQSGGAHLELEAQAEGSGSTGDTVLVRNTSSNKRFLAHIDGKGRVSVPGLSPKTP
jgi:flagella basal body P-ring formation protein FlgA